MKVYNRNSILLIFTSGVLLTLMLLKNGYMSLLTAIIVVVSGKVFEIVLRLIFKNRREYAPLWVLLITPVLFPVGFPIPLILISALFSLVITALFISGGSKIIISPVPVMWIFAALSFPDYFTGGYNNIITIFAIFMGLILLLLRVTSYITLLSFIAAYLLILLLNNELDNGFMSSISSNLVIGAFVILPNVSENPLMPSGKVLMGILTGISLFVINKYSTHREGTMFAVLLCQVFTPLVDDILLNIKLRKRRINA